MGNNIVREKKDCNNESYKCFTILSYLSLTILQLLPPFHRWRLEAKVASNLLKTIDLAIGGAGEIREQCLEPTANLQSRLPPLVMTIHIGWECICLRIFSIDDI